MRTSALLVLLAACAVGELGVAKEVVRESASEIAVAAPLSEAKSLVAARLKRGDPLRRSPNARPGAVTKRVMAENAYAGEWLEEHGEAKARLSFLKDGTGLYQYRWTSVPFHWTSDGRGRIVLTLEQNGETSRQCVTYNPETDTIDLGFKGKKTHLGFTGVLCFVSEKVKKEIAEGIDFGGESMEAPDRDALFDRMMAERDPKLVRIDGPEDFPSVERICAEGLVVKTVDKAYPQLEIRTIGHLPGAVDMTLNVARYDSRPFAKGERTWRIYPHYKGREIATPSAGISKEKMADLIASYAGRDTAFMQDRIPYGTGNDYWYEECVRLKFMAKSRKRCQQFLEKVVAEMTFPRYCIITDPSGKDEE